MEKKERGLERNPPLAHNSQLQFHVVSFLSKRRRSRGRQGYVHLSPNLPSASLGPKEGSVLPGIRSHLTWSNWKNQEEKSLAKIKEPHVDPSAVGDLEVMREKRHDSRVWRKEQEETFVYRSTVRLEWKWRMRNPALIPVTLNLCLLQLLTPQGNTIRKSHKQVCLVRICPDLNAYKNKLEPILQLKCVGH